MNPVWKSAFRAKKIIVPIVVGTSLLLGSGVVAQETSTPVPGSGEAPAPELCTVAPRPTPIWDGTPAVGVDIPPVTVAGPFTPPTGEPVDDGVAAAVEQTITESIACQNAGDLGRMLALFSDNAVRAFFTGPRGYSAADVDATVEAGAAPRPEDQWLRLDGIEGIRLLDDGRVGAMVYTSLGEYVYVDFVYLVRGTTPDGTERWLIDDSVAIDSTTQVEDGPIVIP